MPIAAGESVSPTPPPVESTVLERCIDTQSQLRTFDRDRTQGASATTPFAGSEVQGSNPGIQEQTISADDCPRTKLEVFPSSHQLCANPFIEVTYFFDDLPAISHQTADD